VHYKTIILSSSRSRCSTQFSSVSNALRYMDSAIRSALQQSYVSMIAPWFIGILSCVQHYKNDRTVLIILIGMHIIDHAIHVTPPSCLCLSLPRPLSYIAIVQLQRTRKRHRNAVELPWAAIIINCNDSNTTIYFARIFIFLKSISPCTHNI